MTIDEVIILLKDYSNETDKQIVEWLEELKMLRLDSCMLHMTERFQLLENCYNKALADIENEFLKCDKVHYNIQDILCVINKLKGGE